MYSHSCRDARPGAGGVVGAVRLRADMPVFSSTRSTSAPWGGFTYRPHTSAARSQKSGSSRRVIQPRTWWGLMSSVFRMRPICEREIYPRPAQGLRAARDFDPPATRVVRETTRRQSPSVLVSQELSIPWPRNYRLIVGQSIGGSKMCLLSSRPVVNHASARWSWRAPSIASWVTRCPSMKSWCSVTGI